MDTKFRLLARKVMALEAQGAAANLEAIEQVCLEALRLANEDKLELDADVYRYFEDYDVRRKNPGYWKYQTDLVNSILNRG